MTFTVNSTNDSQDIAPGDGLALDALGNTSLRAAIMEANALVGADIIIVPSGIYQLTIGGVNEDASLTGDLDVSSDIIIVGDETRNTIINADSLDRVFHVLPGALLDLESLTLTQGYVQADKGGGVLNQGDLTMSDVHISHCGAEGSNGGLTEGGYGGGICNESTLQMVKCTLFDNTAQGGAGQNGVAPGGGSGGGGGPGLGGALYGTGVSTTNLTNCTLSGNNAIGGKGGNGTHHQGSGVTASAGGSGGGDGGNGGAPDGNGANGLIGGGGGGGGSVGGDGGDGGFGGGGGGGGASSWGGNAGPAGAGGQYGGNGGVGCCSGGSGGGGGAGLGGALFLNGGDIIIVSTTIAMNEAVGGNGGNGFFSGAGAPGQGIGGGVFNLAGSIMARSSLFGNNVATDSEPDIHGELNSAIGFNLIEVIDGAIFTGTTAGNIINQDPQILPLSDNGGKTDTHALNPCSPVSPAIDVSTAAGTPLTDQRDSLRFLVPDIGAYESRVTPFSASITDLEEAGCSGSLGQAIATPSGGQPSYNYEWSDDTWLIDATQTDSVAALPAGDYHVIVEDSFGCRDTSDFTIDLVIETLDLGPDSALCEGEPLTLDATTPSATYLWQDNSVSADFEVSSSGTYWVEVTANGCVSQDTVIVSYTSLPTVDLGMDTTLCEGEELALDVTASGGTYLWHDNSMTADFMVSSTGMYWVEVTVNDCSNRDSVNVSYSAVPAVDLGPDQTLCQGQTVTLDASALGATYLWQDNSIASGYAVTSAGTYWVDVTVNNCTTRDSVVIDYLPLPAVYLGEDTILCNAEELNLDAFQTGATYLWQDNSIAAGYAVTTAGTYWVQLTIGNCSARDSIVVNYNDDLSLNLGLDTAICVGEVLILDASTPGANYLWQDNSTLSDFEVNQAGLYWVEVSTGGCSSRDSVLVTYTALPMVDLGPDSTLCEGEELSLDVSAAGASYLWQDNSVASNYLITTAGLYWVEVTVDNCNAKDSIEAFYNPLPDIDLGTDTALCDGAALILDVSDLSGTYLWQDNSTDSEFVVNSAGLYSVEVTENDCQALDDILVSYNPYPVVSLGADTAVCENEDLILNASTAGGQYLWQDNSTDATFNVDSEGLHWVEVTVSGCATRDSLSIAFNPVPEASIIGGGLFCSDEFPILDILATGTGPFEIVYTINGGDVTSIDTSEIAFGLLSSGAGIYELVSVTDALCSSMISSSTEVEYYPPITVDLNYPSEVCEGETFIITATPSGGHASGFYIYEWQDEEGNNYNTSSISLADTAALVLTLNVNDECNIPSELYTAMVDVQDYPILSLSASLDTVCLGEQVLFTASGQDESVFCSWEFQDGFLAMGCDGVEHAFGEPGFQAVGLTAVTSAGCEGAILMDSTVFVLGNPNTEFSFEELDGTTISPNVQFINQSAGADSLHWDFGDGEFSDESSPLHLYPGLIPDSYIACLTAYNALGCSDSVCTLIQIESDFLMTIPNAFTPDDDMLNDRIKPIFNDIILVDYSYVVFNRLGEIVFETNDPEMWWNGQGINNPNYLCPDGVYPYLIRARAINTSETLEYRGHITLIR